MKTNSQQRFMATLIAIVLVVSNAMAQAPQAVAYQAVVRNAAGNIVPNKTVSLEFSVFDGSATGTLVYVETQSATTNTLGLFTVNVGQGNVGAFAPKFSTINWQDGTKFLKVAIDTNNGSTYTALGTQQLLSVPFALNAKNGVPVGSIQAFAGDTTKIPDGWMLCDGRELSTTDVKYAALFSVLQSTWGTTTATKFNIPDLRGQFMRGVSYGSLNDPDAVGRTGKVGGNTGNKVGSYQGDMFGVHNHDLNTLGLYMVVNGGSQAGTFANSGNRQTSSSGGNETRPKNVYVNYIIKY